MVLWIIFAAIIIVGGVMIWMIDVKVPVQKKPSLLTPSEEAIFSFLMRPAMSQYGYLVWPQVSLSAIVEAKGKMRNVIFGRWLSHLNKMYIDFLLISRETHQPILAIELDDRSHLYLQRRYRDKYLEGALENAQVKLLRIARKNRYDFRELEQVLIGYLNKTEYFKVEKYG